MAPPRARRLGGGDCVEVADLEKPGAAAAVVDIDEAERVVHRDLALPTAFAVRWQHEGGLVAIMVETGAQISIQPHDASPPDSVVRISGVAGAVGKAVANLELAHANHLEADAARAREAEAQPLLVRIEVPAAHVNAVTGTNGEAVAALREKCGGIM